MPHLKHGIKTVLKNSKDQYKRCLCFWFLGCRCFHCCESNWIFKWFISDKQEISPMLFLLLRLPNDQKLNFGSTGVLNLTVTHSRKKGNTDRCSVGKSDEHLWKKVLKRWKKKTNIDGRKPPLKHPSVANCCK